ncbi:MAG: ATP-binding protein, partial [Spongiibacteraceae bacterium]
MSLGFTAIAWPLFVGMCLAIGFIHAIIWLKRLRDYAHLAMVVIALSIAVLILGEMFLMRAQTPAQFGQLERWLHVPVFTFFVGAVLFVRVYLRAGRVWLAWLVCGLRLLSLLVNFLHDPNLHYDSIDYLQPVRIWGGETVVVAVGVSSKWQLIAQLSTLLLFIYFAEATFTAWRRARGGDRRRIVIVGGSFMLTLIIALVSSLVMHWSDIAQPFYMFPSYLAVVIANSFELGNDVIRSIRLGEELKSANAELRKVQEQMDQISDAAAVGMWEWDYHRDTIWATEQTRTLYGFDAVGPINFDRFLSAVHVEDRAALRESALQSLKDSNRFQREYRIIHADHSVTWVLTRGRVERTGAAVVLRGISLNVSERKQTELDLVQQRNELAHLSRVMMLSELSGSLAHELNQPLAAILSNAQAALRFLAYQDPNLDEIREILRDIVADDKRAGEVIQGLRAMLKKGELRRELVDPNALVLDVVRLLRSDMLNAGVIYATELPPDLPKVNGIYVQLQQVLLNLMINACDAMTDVAATRRRLTVSTALDGMGYVVFRVCDQGHGIPVQDVTQVFQPFYTTKVHGLGLGLAVCRRLIDAHGGKMWATNN